MAIHRIETCAPSANAVAADSNPALRGPQERAQNPSGRCSCSEPCWLAARQTSLTLHSMRLCTAAQYSAVQPTKPCQTHSGFSSMSNTVGTPLYCPHPTHSSVTFPHQPQTLPMWQTCVSSRSSWRVYRQYEHCAPDLLSLPQPLGKLNFFPYLHSATAIPPRCQTCSTSCTS
jgi:hypothetical protein